ncbi:MAG: PDZ domain-containing protein [Pirellulaceae bacterium]
MPNLLRLICLCASIVMSAALSGQETPPAPGSPAKTTAPLSQPSPEQVSTWIQNLSAQQFVARETATLKLIEAGSPVIAALVKKLPGSNPEATARIIHILRQLALDEEWTVNDPALQALQQIAKQEGTAAGRRATSTLLKLGALREQRAIREITQLGGSISQSSIQFGLQLVFQRVIHLGPQWHGSPRDLQRLKWIRSAEAVVFEGDQVKDSWMPHLAGMTQLRSLTLKRAAITDKGMESLAELKNLISLDIKYVPISDSSVATLKNLAQLRYIKLYGTQITKEAAVKLQNALAAAEVDHRNGAFLGVGCPQPPEPCIITSIQPGTAAEKAGLRTGDWIVSFSGESVRDFNDLKKLIGQWRPGDKTTVQIMRTNSPKFSNLRKGDEVTADLDVTKHPLGLKLNKLDEKSPWYQAGLRADDVIHKLDGERIRDTETLKKELVAATQGALLQVIYYRQPQLRKYNLELGAWK